MGIFSFNKARRRTMIKEEDNVFTEIDKMYDKQKTQISLNKVRPSFSGGQEKKPKVSQIIKEKRKQAEDKYLFALASGNEMLEKNAAKELNKAKTRIKKYKEIKKEQRERKLEPIKKGFKALSNFSKNVAIKQKKNAAKGIFKGFGQQSNITFGEEISNSPFAPKNR